MIRWRPRERPDSQSIKPGTSKQSETLSGFPGARLRAVSLYAHVSVEKRASCLRVPLPSRAFHRARDDFRVSRVSLDGLRNKRDCSKSTREEPVKLGNG